MQMIRPEKPVGPVTVARHGEGAPSGGLAAPSAGRVRTGRRRRPMDDECE